MFIDFPEVDIAIQGIEEIKFPKMVKIRQKYDASRIDDLPAWVAKEMRNNLPDREATRAKRYVSLPEAGDPYLEIIIRAVCDELKNWGRAFYRSRHGQPWRRCCRRPETVSCRV